MAGVRAQVPIFRHREEFESSATNIFSRPTMLVKKDDDIMIWSVETL